MIAIFRGPNGAAHTSEEEKKDCEGDDKVHFGGALVDIHDGLPGGLWIEAHGKEMVEGW
jgi:hypothetical protein